jgi:formate hydrogenlyase subunit 6/NADH:ubiquinone oxidoreductase subunit I
MTISVQDYFEKVKPDRKKETRYIAVINKNSCTSCNACATMCPVDCIFEVVSPIPSQSYHQIDTSRCIGCQLCYRIPTLSTEHYTLEICPWNAIDMLNNPNVEDGEPVLQAYYAGSEQEVPWSKLEEYGYQLYLNESVQIRSYTDELVGVMRHFTRPHWSWGEGNFSVVREPEQEGPYLNYRTTPEGLAMLRTVFEHYPKLFLD